MNVKLYFGLLLNTTVYCGLSLIYYPRHSKYPSIPDPCIHQVVMRRMALFTKVFLFSLFWAAVYVLNSIFKWEHACISAMLKTAAMGWGERLLCAARSHLPFIWSQRVGIFSTLCVCMSVLEQGHDLSAVEKNALVHTASVLISSSSTEYCDTKIFYYSIWSLGNVTNYSNVKNVSHTLFF